MPTVPAKGRRGSSPERPLAWTRFQLHFARGFACIAAMAALTGAAHPGQGPGTQPPSMNPDRPYLLPDANRLPNVNDQMRMRERKKMQQNFDAANFARKKQIADDSSKLVTLAIALKAELDNNPNNTLSANEVRKADEIEKLARDVKEKMKLTVGAN
jgi:hypothetical protein